MTPDKAQAVKVQIERICCENGIHYTVSQVVREGEVKFINFAELSIKIEREKDNR
jgi:hypothetical protein